MWDGTVVVTGANAGIGYEVALHFAKLGARVVMACRSMEKAERAEYTIRRVVSRAKLCALPLDVSELGSIREFGRQFRTRVGELDVLVNNAGVAPMPLARTSAGHELQFATNYLGGFALAGALLPAFRRNTAGRIVNVGSLAHRFGALDLDDLNWQRSPYDPWKAYARSKLAALTHVFELNRRLCDLGSGVVALAAHPGLANTEIGQKSETLRPKTRLRRWYTKQMTKVIPSAATAARSVIVAAGAKGVRRGDYYGPSGLLELGGVPARARVNPLAADPNIGRMLWSASEMLTGVRYLSSRA